MGDARTEVVRARFPGRPSSVRAARHLLRSRAEGHLWDGDLDTAELLVSELVTNAVVHAGTSFELVVCLRGGTTLRVEVVDGSAQHPTARRHSLTAGTGRGLHLLDELADRWGVAVGSKGKTVWFELTVTGVRAGGGTQSWSEPVAGAGSAEGGVLVELLDVPLRLHALWLQQAEALLRDYLLATLDESDSDAPILAHSRCSDAISLLAAHIPAPGAVSVVDGVVDVVDAGVSGPCGEEWCPRVAVHVPHGSVPHFATLDQTLELALELAGADRLLAAVTDPAGQELRRWLCRQVAQQARGERPVSWRAAHASHLARG